MDWQLEGLHTPQEMYIPPDLKKNFLVVELWDWQLYLVLEARIKQLHLDLMPKNPNLVVRMGDYCFMPNGGGLHPWLWTGNLVEAESISMLRLELKRAFTDGLLMEHH